LIQNGDLHPTHTLCPECLAEVDGRLLFRDGAIWVRQECPAHGVFTGLVDPDAELYRRCAAPPARPRRPYATVIPISLRCNMDCTWCYLPDRAPDEEWSIEEVLDIVARSGTAYVILSGGEPTLRTDLRDLIVAIKRADPSRLVGLLTNGRRLTDAGYLDTLAGAGLDCVILSLNGFRGTTHRFFNDGDLTAEKDTVLRNLKHIRMRTVLSMTLAKGVNDDEFPAVFDYAIHNLDFVRQVRIRNVTELGTHATHPRLYMSEMIRLVADATGFSVEECCLGNEVASRHLKTGYRFSVHVFTLLKQRAKWQARASAGRSLSPAEWAARSRALFLDEIARRADPETARRLEENPEQGFLALRDFLVEIFSWPTPGNIDLDECRRSSVNHVTLDGTVLPFQVALYTEERRRLARGAPPARSGRGNDPGHRSGTD
jgi:pyruvate-formate lyase-activating enzyme